MQWGKIFMKRHLHFGFKDLFFFSFFFQYPKIEYILNFKIDICDFKKASIPLYIESTSALLKRNEDKAYHYIAKKQKWNYGTIYFSRQLTFKLYLLIWESKSYFQIERNCRPDNYIEPFIGLKLQINILHLNNWINIQLELWKGHFSNLQKCKQIC